MLSEDVIFQENVFTKHSSIILPLICTCHVLKRIRVPNRFGPSRLTVSSATEKIEAIEHEQVIPGFRIQSIIICLCND